MVEKVFTKQGVTIFIMQLYFNGYFIADSRFGNQIFVKSDLPKKERSKIIRWGLQQKEKQGERVEIFIPLRSEVC